MLSKLVRISKNGLNIAKGAENSALKQNSSVCWIKERRLSVILVGLGSPAYMTGLL